MKIEFDEVSLKATRRWIDENGRRRQETRFFAQTLNPWNLNARGERKTREEILAELEKAREAWLRRHVELK